MFAAGSWRDVDRLITQTRLDDNRGLLPWEAIDDQAMSRDQYVSLDIEGRTQPFLMKV
jgi:hypothetical protein